MFHVEHLNIHTILKNGGLKFLIINDFYTQKPNKVEILIKE